MWQKKPLVVIHLVSLLLVALLLIPGFWKELDVKAFYFFNSLITDYSYVQIFWAFCNTKMHNWVFDVIVIVFCSSYVLTSPKTLRFERGVKVFVAFVLMLALFFFDHYFFNRYLHVERLSPSLQLDGTLLRDVVPWLRSKAVAKRSYPGGHALTGFLFLAIVSFTTNKRWTLIAVLLTIPLLIMPRLVAGAHWLSDILLGSFLMTMIPASWILCSPLFPKITNGILFYGKKRDPRPHRPDTP